MEERQRMETVLNWLYKRKKSKNFVYPQLTESIPQQTLSSKEPQEETHKDSSNWMKYLPTVSLQKKGVNKKHIRPRVPYYGKVRQSRGVENSKLENKAEPRFEQNKDTNHDYETEELLWNYNGVLSKEETIHDYSPLLLEAPPPLQPKKKLKIPLQLDSIETKKESISTLYNKPLTTLHNKPLNIHNKKHEKKKTSLFTSSSRLSAQEAKHQIIPYHSTIRLVHSNGHAETFPVYEDSAVFTFSDAALAESFAHKEDPIEFDEDVQTTRESFETALQIVTDRVTTAVKRIQKESQMEFLKNVPGRRSKVTQFIFECLFE